MDNPANDTPRDATLAPTPTEAAEHPKGPYARALQERPQRNMRRTRKPTSNVQLSLLESGCLLSEPARLQLAPN